MGERRVIHRVYLGRPDGERRLGRLRRTCMFDIEMDLKKWRWEMD
jgi:hypothetical protein